MEPTRAKSRVKFGHEVFFQSCIVGCDDKGVIYIRTTGFDAPVQLVRIKPQEYAAVAAHLLSRIEKPHQGHNAKHKKEFVPLNERLARQDYDDDEEEEQIVEEEKPVVLVSPGTQFPTRRRVTSVEILPQEPQVTPPPVYRVRRRVVPA